MSLFIGADLGTSALKLTLADGQGRIIRSRSEHYPLIMLSPGFSEQSPNDWWQAFVAGVLSLLHQEEKSSVEGIAIAGQMHGLVALGENDVLLRNAILWNDSRSVKECAYLNETIGKACLLSETGNIAYPGFTAPKILWMKDHEPELFKKIRHVLLPKDYLVHRLTGIYATEPSDAAGTLLFDVKNRQWSSAMLAIMGLPADVMPSLYESGAIVGRLLPNVSAALGLSSNVFVVAGAADNAAAALGSGVQREGSANISLGTSGTIDAPCDSYRYDPLGAIHSFIGADGRHCLLACSLSSASCLRWLYENVFLTADYAAEEARITRQMLGHNRVFFLPYLMGERSPINDPKARGLFIGMDLTTHREDLSLAVLEGISFALRDSFERMKALGVSFHECHITGGGTKNPLLCEILSAVLATPLVVVKEESGASYGMCLLAATAAGFSLSPVALSCPEIVIKPNPALVSLYEEKYRRFSSIYPSVKMLYPQLLD